jgi:L-histidine N-alpha-methyltransferase
MTKLISAAPARDPARAPRPPRGDNRAHAPPYPDELDFAHAVALGLSDTPRWIPSRFLYDARGSALFEEITRLPEYYLTRTETRILRDHASDIRHFTGPVSLIELGSGTSVKTSLLLDAYGATRQPVTYVSIDVSPSALEAAGRSLSVRHPGVRFVPIQRRYEDAFALFPAHSPCLVIFLGSTVGNFNHAESIGFWSSVSRHLAPGDGVLLGVDLVKDQRILEAAYNDAAGVTAEFTRNVFHRMNRELDAGLDVAAIEHVAAYNAPWRRIEIFGRFTRDQAVRIRPLDLTIPIAAGEAVMVEVSRKFVIEDITRYLACLGLHTRATYTDPDQWFAVLLLEKQESPS